jgi:heat shock protein HslJ
MSSRVAAVSFATVAFVLAAAACGGDKGGDSAPLKGVVWEWQGSSYSDDSDATPADPRRYTVEFVDDGSLAIKADCNRVRGSYTDDGSTLTIELGPSTKAACPPDSLDSEFLRDLAAASTYALESGALRIDLKLDTGSMQLAPAS